MNKNIKINNMMNKINNIKYEISVNSFGKIENPILNIKLEKIQLINTHIKKKFQK